MRSAELKTMRENAGIPQSGLAAWAGVSRTTISQMETGKREVSEKVAESMMQIAAKQAATLSDLKGEPDPAPETNAHKEGRVAHGNGLAVSACKLKGQERVEWINAWYEEDAA